MALHHCVKQLVWLRQLMQEIGLGSYVMRIPGHPQRAGETVSRPRRAHQKLERRSAPLINSKNYNQTLKITLKL